MFKNSCIISFILVLFSGIYCLSDEIHLSNGQKAATEILDTNGCSVTIKRKGNKVKITKELIKEIIWNSDTIDYSTYKCEQKKKTAVKAVKFEDTPEYKLMVFIDNCDEIEQEFEPGNEVLYLIAPLQGNYNIHEYLAIQKPLIEQLSKKATLKQVTIQNVLDQIKAENPIAKYAFVARKYHVEIFSITPNKLGPDREKKKQLVTSAEFVLIDLERKEVVFHPDLYKKRNLYGAGKYSWTGILTPDAWEKAWEKDWTKRNLDKNAKTLRKKLMKRMKKYLRIKG